MSKVKFLTYQIANLSICTFPVDWLIQSLRHFIIVFATEKSFEFSQSPFSESVLYPAFFWPRVPRLPRSPLRLPLAPPSPSSPPAPRGRLSRERLLLASSLFQLLCRSRRWRWVRISLHRVRSRRRKNEWLIRWRDGKAFRCSPKRWSMKMSIVHSIILTLLTSILFILPPFNRSHWW